MKICGVTKEISLIGSDYPVVASCDREETHEGRHHAISKGTEIWWVKDATDRYEGMNPAESRVLDLTARAFDAFVKITADDTNAEDRRDFCNAINTCQRIVMARAYQKKFPGGFSKL